MGGELPVRWVRMVIQLRRMASAFATAARAPVRREASIAHVEYAPKSKIRHPDCPFKVA